MPANHKILQQVSENNYFVHFKNRVGWNIQTDRPGDPIFGEPDRVFEYNGEKIGLELTQIFQPGDYIEKSIDNSTGSRMREAEGQHQSLLRKAARAYYSSPEAIPLKVQCGGRGWDSWSLRIKGPSALLARVLMRVAQRALKPRECVRLGGREARWLRVTVLPNEPQWKGYSRWQFMDDSVGWVLYKPSFVNSLIQQAITTKAQKLAFYRQAISGKVMLLLIADHLLGSGMISAEHDLCADLKGFDRVFFMEYPDKVLEVEAVSLGNH